MTLPHTRALAFACVGACSILAAELTGQETAGPIARATVPDGQQIVVVGQPVTIGIEALVPTFFRGAPSYEALEIPGAIAFFNERGTNFTRRIDGNTWAGQRRSYTVYPNRAGTYDVGPIPVEVRYGVGSQVVVDTAFAPLVRFEAVIPDEASGVPVFVAAAELRIDQIVAPTTDTIRVGDAVERVVTTEVEGTLSMVVPPMAFDSIPGLAVYPAPPRLEDTGGERGSAIVGQRVESVSYVALEEGSYALPAVTVAWWDWTAGILRRAEASGVEFVVVANPDLVTEIELPPDSLDVAETADANADGAGVDDRFRRLALWLMATALMTWVAYRLLAPRLPVIRARLDSSRRARADGEAAHFRQLQAAATANDAEATANALAAWIARFEAEGRSWTVRELAAGTRNDALEVELERLGRALYGPNQEATSAWSGASLVAAISAARSELKRGAPAIRNRDIRDLAPLNPGTS